MMRVLLIDDDPDDRALARRALEKELPGIEVIEMGEAEAFERELLLEREREARAAAEQASLIKDEFLATLSHELRTPLNAIVGWSNLLLSGTLEGEKLTRALESIERNARSQTRLIDDLLDVSAIISGKMRLEVRPFRLPAVIEAALDAVRPAAEARGVHLEAACDPEIGPVAGDADRVQQIVWNLLSNAVKFTPSGGAVWVVAERDDHHARIIVTDTGRGIAPDFLEHVFEPFRQADGSTTRATGGLGLGLAIVRRLVELHGGRVIAQSEGIGHGAQFTVEIPLDVLEPERRAHHEPEEDRLRLSLDGLRVLVVDDEPDVRELLTTVLEAAGASVCAVESAAEGLRVFSGFRPGVVLCDIAMPEVDGYEMVHRLRALPAAAGGRVPAAALSAYARVEDRRRALLAGFNIHVAKPVDPEELITVVASLAGKV
jgi:signal transduction histidine kinase/ActR/RegA family two-component response regulator